MSSDRSSPSYLPVRQSSPTREYPLARPTGRWSTWTFLKFTLIAVSTLVVIHATLAWAAPDHPYTSALRDKLSGTASWRSAPLSAAYRVDETSQPNRHGDGAFHRDARPIQSILAFWDLAEREVLARSLDTCDDKLGRRFIEAYASTQMAYCVPEGTAEDAAAMRITNPNDTRSSISCDAIHRHGFTQWWPYPAAPCISRNLRAVVDDRRAFRAAGCEVTPDGMDLLKEMKKEDFAGVRSTSIALDDDAAHCKETIDHTTLLIGRQDQWNPSVRPQVDRAVLMGPGSTSPRT